MIFLLLVALALATKPSHLSLVCNKNETATKWINGALDSLTVLYQTLFGGWNCNGQLIDACYEEAEKLDASTCINPTDPTCTEGCNLGDQITVDDECCKDEFAAPTMDGESICRTNRKWVSIAVDKLYTAFDEFDKQTTEGYDTAISLACAAETILAAVLESLGSAFLVDGVTYRHIVSPQYQSAFAGSELSSFTTRARTVQSFRDCPHSGDCRDHALVATYTLFRSSVDTLPTGINQLLWPISGTLSNFDKTQLPSDSHCAQIQAFPSISPATNLDWRLPTLGHLDYARVVQSFSRCSGFPVSGCVQGYHDLSINRCCNTLTLIKDIAKTASLLPPGDDAIVYSFVYVAHYQSKFTYEANPTRDNHVEVDILVRTAAADQCVESQVTGTTVLSFEPTYDILSLTPSTSRCVGGPDTGKACSRQNKCGAGLTCTARPGTHKSFCFDGTWWNDALPCDGVVECGYGECYTSDARGNIPYQRVWNENSCDDSSRANNVCNDAKLRAWSYKNIEI